MLKLARLRHWTTCWFNSSAVPYILCPQMGHGVFELEPELLAPPIWWWWWPFSGVSSRSSARRLRALALTRFVRLIRMRWKVSQRVSCSRFCTCDVAAGADMGTDDPEGLPPWWCEDERKVLETRSSRSNSCTKWTSKSEDLRVMPQTGQHDGSSGDFLRPIWKCQS